MAATDPRKIRQIYRRFIVFYPKNGKIERSAELEYEAIFKLKISEVDIEKLKKWVAWCGRGDYFQLEKSLILCTFGKKAVRLPSKE